jgi:hypothetical protein
MYMYIYMRGLGLGPRTDLMDGWGKGGKRLALKDLAQFGKKECSKMRQMSCYELRVLMHYYYSPEEHPDFERNPPVWEPTVDKLIRAGLVMLRMQGATAYVITEKGSAHVEALLNFPLPVQRWISLMPTTATTVDPREEA